MQKGTITSLGDRQSGFIRRPGIKEELFFHADHLVDGLSFQSLKKNDKVHFSIIETKNGPYAIDVGKS